MIESIQIAIFVGLTVGATAAAFVAVGRTECGARLKLGVLLLSVLTIAAGLTLSERGIAGVRANLRDQIIGFAPTYADEFMNHRAADLGFDTPPDDPVYLELIETQKRWLSVNPAIADIYTFRVVDGECRLIVDSETDYNRDGEFSGEREMRTTIGESFAKAQADEYAAMEGQQVFVDSPYTSRAAFARSRISRGTATQIEPVRK